LSRWCNGQHKTVLTSWSWFDSGSGYCLARVFDHPTAGSDYISKRVSEPNLRWKVIVIPDPTQLHVGITS
jgi:hypothetical protein